MGWYRVCLNTIVRKDVKLDSERLRILPMGSRVNVVQKNGRRVMIDQPIKGWCSLSSSNGDTILKPLSDDTSTQTPRSNPEAQADHYKKEADAARQQAAEAKEEEEKQALRNKAAQYDALSAQVTAQQKAHEQEMNALSAAATSTNVQDMVFRDGDVIQLAKKNHQKGLVIVRTTIQIDDAEWVGVDYDANSHSPMRPAENGSHPSDKEATCHFKSGPNMKGGWVLRNEITGYISGGSIVPQLNAQVVENEILKSTLGALKEIIKDLSQTKYKGLDKEIHQKAKAFESRE